MNTSLASSLALLLLLLLLSATRSLALDNRWQPCVEVKRDLRIPCECAITVSGLNKTTLALQVDCDRMILSDDALANLEGQPIISFSQQACGYQDVPASLLDVLADNLEKLDLSGNMIHRMMDRKLQGRSSLRELRLASNALGDSLNPIFSSYEFHELTSLRLLDLRHNAIRSIEEGILKGCGELEELYLDYNSLRQAPIDSLKGPAALKILGLAGNQMVSIQRGVFSPLGPHLQRLDLSSNELSHLEDGAFLALTGLAYLNLSDNELQHLNSDVLKGAYNLKQLDLSSNFLQQFPTEALRHQRILESLNFSNNLITELERTHLTSVTSLQVLDLSRNNMGRLGVKTFTDLTALVRLDLSLNALRAIEESAFQGLLNLKWLSLQDNNVLLVPSAALARLPALVNLQLDYNRIAVLSSELVHASAPRLSTFSLTHNLVRELPPRLFARFDRLSSVNLSGNTIASINPQTFVGLEDTLVHLDLSHNRLSAVGEIPLRLLQSFNLAGNHLKKVAPETFKHLDRLLHLNMSDNPLYGGFPPLFPRSLLSLDVSRTGLRILPPVLLLNLLNLEQIWLSANRLRKIGENTFKHLFNLSSIDLSYNEIEEIESEAFVGVMNLRRLNLRGNKLTIFAGEYFNTGTGLLYLDLSHNQLEHLTPTSFLIHPRLKLINLAGNRLSAFPSEFVKSLQFVEYLDLSSSRMSAIGEFAFAQMARLRELDLSGNEIESVDELAFHNSTQLQRLDLSSNRLSMLSERMLEGVLRLEKLDLRDNLLTSLPDKMFDTSRVRSLERLDISGNKFMEIPAEALRRQTSHLVSLSLARNRLSEVFNHDVLDTVKQLDLSENPLSENSSFRILSEAKVLRSLNMASCGIHRISKVEAPFLRRLDLSCNGLAKIEPKAFERTTMLEQLNVSANKLPSVSMIASAFASAAPMLVSLDMSSNDMKAINESSLHGFESLRELKMANLEKCTRIEKSAFKSMTKLRRLEAHNYPRLGYLDAQGIVKGMNLLQVLDVEMKADNEQLSVRLHPRLRSLTLRGDRFKNLLSSLLIGIKTQQLELGLKNTSIDAIPTTLLFPVPRSTKLVLDVTGSKLLTSIPQQLTSVLEERTGAFRFKGLDMKIKCDCSVKYLWRWSKKAASDDDNSIECTAPESLKNQSLNDLTEDDLSCEPEKRTTLQVEHTEATTNVRRPSTSMEPEIIWTVASATQGPRQPQNKKGDNFMNVSIGSINGTDDTLIIGIVGGVVAFIAIVVMIICICRLRWSNQMNEAQMHATMAPSIHEASMLRPASVYSGKMNHQDVYVGSYKGSTLGHSKKNAAMSLPATPVQMLPFVQPVPMIQSAAGGQPIYGYYDGSGMPIYMTTAPESTQDR